MDTLELPPDFKELLSLLNSHGVEVSIISLEDLKANKRASGRPKTLADLSYLP